MNIKVISWIGVAIFSYAIFAVGIFSFYPDTPHNMDWEDRQEYNQVQISKMELGLDKREILKLLGSPDLTEAKRLDDNELQVMFYRTKHQEADGITTQDECTALLFENGKLIAIGNHAYQTFIDG